VRGARRLSTGRVYRVAAWTSRSRRSRNRRSVSLLTSASARVSSSPPLRGRRAGQQLGSRGVQQVVTGRARRGGESIDQRGGAGAGPSTIATARRRLRATMERAAGARGPRRADDLRPVRCPRPAPPDSAGRRSPPAARTARARRAAPLDECSARRSARGSSGAILSSRENHLAGVVQRASRRESCSSMRARSAVDSPGGGSSAPDNAAQTDGLGAESVRTSASPRVAALALGEDEVDHRQHRVEPARHVLVSGTNRDAGVANLAFARTRRCAIVDTGTRKARAISSVSRPPACEGVSAPERRAPAPGAEVKISRRRCRGSRRVVVGSSTICGDSPA